MNILTLVALVGLFLSWMVYKIYTGFKTNIAKARATGYPVLITPIYPLTPLWLTLRPLLTPLLTTLLPSSLYSPWIFIMTPEWEYHPSPRLHFAHLNTDTFIAASWNGLACFTSDANVIHQVMSRREAFPKDTRQYGILEMFGANVVTTEGARWRWHRKVTSGSFNERNAGHTFREGVRQTGGLIGEWFRRDGGAGDGEREVTKGEDGEEVTETKTITTLEHDTMRWALNIIGYVGFGLKLLWPHEKMPRDVDPKLAKYGELTPPEGYTMTFADSLATVLERIIVLLLVPSAVLKRYPVSWKWGKKMREAWEAKENYTKYMKAFLAEKKEDIQAGRKEKEGMNIMGQLVRSKYDTSEKQDDGAWKMEDSDIMGNAFIMTLAGHETTANVTHFTLIELAIHPEAQRLVQRDIDSIFGRDSDPETWDYEKSINALLASYIGAVINETLRLIPPVVTTPKRVAETDQYIIDKETGERHQMPAMMPVMPIITAVQRNKKYWPAVDKTKQGPAGDLDEWLPARWFLSSQGQSSTEEKEEEENFGGYTGADTSPTLFRPVRGSFVPFSDGARSCLGRRIAMVEMVAAIAVLFQRYSVELAVDEWASDEEVKRMSKEEKREVFRKAQKKAEDTLTTAKSVLTLKLTGGRHVPVRFVKRGRERFVGDEELEL
ncbi:cytochrome P450 [Sordaria brevicollis]|uniref:Cytochrome P450 n=1 Tax=Sordaria brevicollis TaxID=83679 RepID=A0AAE0U5R5_SORBR|nr:cytochrome P450 [Sordaria brevicollis]